MNRQKILIIATISFVAFAIVYWVWSGWGLITVEVNAKPLAEVIRSIEKQGGVLLKTNMDPAKPVTMHVHKVPLTEAERRNKKAGNEQFNKQLWDHFFLIIP